MNNQERIERMESLLQEKLQPSFLNITDDSQHHVGHPGAATGMGHFSLEISAPSLSKSNLVNSHRQIYDALGDMMQTEIHALRIVVR